ncbi:MAG TPA: nitrate/nitrite transporter [Solirubrobacteraceae bacterium]|nr:nitrate/nitrite transporter [Solirubrobacteraceae bacterium]
MSPPPVASSPRAGGHGRWIDHWDPENPEFWATQGRRIARRNLVLSILAEHLGFNVWVLWTVVVINLSNVGISLSVGDQFLLTAVPNLIGSLLRIPYTFAVPRFGGRAWTTFSASLLLLPCLLLAVVVPSGWLAHAGHSTQLWVLLACAATAGVGGGNFSSSMANISFFYPEGRKGLALGLNAAGGNLGVAACQLVIPLIIIVGVPATAVKLPLHHVHLAYAGLVWMPFIVAIVIAAWWRMDSLTQARTDAGPYRAALANRQTWVISLLYIGTFGSFIGYSFALPIVIKNTFPAFLAHHSFIATYLAGLSFVGALVGSLARPVGGWLADRHGGARVTLGCFAGMALATAAAIDGVQAHSFTLFFAAFMVVFLCSGAGNGSTYRMIPSIYSAQSRRAGGSEGQRVGRPELEIKRQAAGAIGIAGAVGALGGFVIQLALRQASLPAVAAMKAAARHVAGHSDGAAVLAKVAAAHATWSVPALWAFLAGYVLLGGLTWFCYLRARVLSERFPSLAGELI